DVMSLFYSAKYATPEGIAVFRIYTSILLFRFTYWGIVLNATGKTKLILYSSIASMVLNLIGNVAMYHAFGFIGPAIATIIATVTMNGVQLVYTKKQLNISITRIFPWKNMAVYLLETVVLGVIFWGVKNILLGNLTGMVSIVASIGLGGCWAVIFAAINIKKLLSNWKGLNASKTTE
ncbi:MAG: polysaccharide biosynthesis C-terminal domain-containing protein, partial [Clostridia bacterium]|nr:polysaccharide biosynthesis C-terminal domain-containing protein [Clostridia bacterium]